MKQITINYILHDRDHYVKSFLNEIIKIDEDLKQNLNINFLITSNNNDRENGCFVSSFFQIFTNGR